mgnify:CR=1 FL=1
MKKLLPLIIFLFSVSSYACECALGLGFKDYVNSADIIFYGTVVSINDDKFEGYKDMLDYDLNKENYPAKYGYKPGFEILEIFKGKFKKPLENGIYNYVADWMGCDRIFKKGYSYIVFGHFQENGEITTSICTLGGIVNEPEYFEKLRAVIKSVGTKE